MWHKNNGIRIIWEHLYHPSRQLMGLCCVTRTSQLHRPAPEMLKKCKEKAKMETIIIYHRHVLAALYPVKEWTNDRAKKAGEMAV